MLTFLHYLAIIFEFCFHQSTQRLSLENIFYLSSIYLFSNFLTFLIMVNNQKILFFAAFLAPSLFVSAATLSFSSAPVPVDSEPLPTVYAETEEDPANLLAGDSVDIPDDGIQKREPNAKKLRTVTRKQSTTSSITCVNAEKPKTTVIKGTTLRQKIVTGKDGIVTKYPKRVYKNKKVVLKTCEKKVDEVTPDPSKFIYTFPLKITF